MSENWQDRTRMLLGQTALERLAAARVAVFGIGGVGGYAVEVIARSGVGSIDLIDNDTVCPSNINRQIIALHSTVGMNKVEVARRRVLDINPECHVCVHKMFYLPDNADEIDLTKYDYVVDCIDTIKAKIDLVARCTELHVPIISSMGAANKMDATAWKVADISKTTIDPIAKIMRKKLRKMGIDHLKVAFSEEQPIVAAEPEQPFDNTNKIVSDTEMPETSSQKSFRPTPASNAFIPAVAGIIIGSEVVKDLISPLNIQC